MARRYAVGCGYWRRCRMALEGDDPGGRSARHWDHRAPGFDGHQRRALRAYIEQMLAPTLCPDDIVMLDNLTNQKAAALPRRLRHKALRTAE
jgi:hypothetical protein